MMVAPDYLGRRSAPRPARTGDPGPGQTHNVSILVTLDVVEPTRPSGAKVGIARGVPVPLMRSAGVAPDVRDRAGWPEQRQGQLQQALARKPREAELREGAHRAGPARCGRCPPETLPFMAG
jgi:hypothetical protein